MPTNLTGNTIASTFDQLLHVDDGPTATEKTVYSGTGVATALKLGTESASVENIQLDGNTIRTLDTNGNLVLAPNGTGSVSMSKVAITGGTISGITDLAIADGGTGASTAGDARTNLGLGTMAVQNANNVSITGGTLTNVTVAATDLVGGVTGSLPYQTAASDTAMLAIGAANRVLTSTGSAPQWSNSLTGLASIVSTGNISGTSLTIHPALNGKIGSNTAWIGENSTATVAIGMYQLGSGFTNIANINFISAGSTIRSAISCSEDASGDAAVLTFSTRTAAGVVGERLRLLSSGVLVTGTTESGTFTTSNTVTGLTVTNNSISADGTDANINISLVPKGTGAVLSSGKLGYPTGTGGAVTQLTSRTTGVTLNKISGEITLFAGAISGHDADEFTLTNSTIEAHDVVVLCIKSGAAAGTRKYYQLHVVEVSAGACVISVGNNDNATIPAVGTESPVIQFVVIKGANA